MNSFDHLDCSHGVGSILEYNFYFRKQISLHQSRQLLEFVLVLFLLTIWISDVLCLAHIIKIRMNSLSISFQDERSSSYFQGSCSNLELMRILLIICIAVILSAVWYNIIYIFLGSKFLSHH